MTPDQAPRVLVAGATGFVGGRLLPMLDAAGLTAVGASRSPDRARAGDPGREWVALDVDRPETLGPALAGCDALVYLVHGMAGGGDYKQRELDAARRVGEAAEAAGVRKIVYLGGVAPSGDASRHLQSRMRTGEILRAGPVPTIELRAGMIIGSGSLSWQIVRDLAVRLPAMVLPAWLSRRSQPVAVHDVCAAICHALTEAPAETLVADIPGPETLTARDVLVRIAALRGRQPLTISIPLLTPRLSSYWIRFVTRAEYRVAAELVEGLTCDLIADGPGYWTRMPGHELLSFDDAARRSLEADEARLTPFQARCEAVLRAISPRLQPLSGTPALAVSAAAVCLFAAAHLGAHVTPWGALAAAVAPLVLCAFLFDLARLRALVPGWRELAIGGALGLLMSAATYALYAPLADRVPSIARSVPLLYEQLRAPPGPYLMFPLIALVVAIEELVWRGTLHDELDRRLGPISATTVAVALYALPALAGGVVLAAVACICGLFWTLERRVTGSLAACVVTHLVWNATVMIAWPLV